MKSSIKEQIARAAALIITAMVIVGFVAGDEGMTITTKSDKARTLFKEAWIESYQTGDMQKVSGLMKQALELDADFALANLWYGYTGFGGVEREKYMNAAFEQRDKVSEAEKHFIQAYMEMEYSKRDEAINELLTVIKLVPGDNLVHLQLAAAYLYFGKKEEALEWVKKSCELDPNFAGAVSYQGYILWTMERYDEAEVLYRKSLEMSPDNPQFLNRYGQLLRATGRVDEAIKMHTKALSIKEEYQPALFLGHCYVAADNYPAAREAYLKAKDVSATNGQKNFCLYSVGTTWLYEGNLPRALSAFDTQIEFNRQLGGRDENIVGATINKAYSCLLYEDYASCAKFIDDYKGYLSTLKLAESDRVYFNQYVNLMEGYMHAYSGKTDMAEKYLDLYVKSLTEAEMETYKLDLQEMRGIIDFQNGKYKEAIGNLEQSGAMAQYYAGLSYEKLGDTEKAKETYSKIVNNKLTSFDLAAAKPFARKRLAQL